MSGPPRRFYGVALCRRALREYCVRDRCSAAAGPPRNLHCRRAAQVGFRANGCECPYFSLTSNLKTGPATALPQPRMRGGLISPAGSGVMTALDALGTIATDVNRAFESARCLHRDDEFAHEVTGRQILQCTLVVLECVGAFDHGMNPMLHKKCCHAKEVCTRARVHALRSRRLED
jgi:hypothetical protein